MGRELTLLNNSRRDLLKMLREVDVEHLCYLNGFCTVVRLQLESVSDLASSFAYACTNSPFADIPRLVSR